MICHICGKAKPVPVERREIAGNPITLHKSCAKRFDAGVTELRRVPTPGYGGPRDPAPDPDLVRA